MFYFSNKIDLNIYIRSRNRNGIETQEKRELVHTGAGGHGGQGEDKSSRNQINSENEDKYGMLVEETNFTIQKTRKKCLFPIGPGIGGVYKP
jgi:hypothetical protein